jgi:hypothetical protein
LFCPSSCQCNPSQRDTDLNIHNNLQGPGNTLQWKSHRALGRLGVGRASESFDPPRWNAMLRRPLVAHHGGFAQDQRAGCSRGHVNRHHPPTCGHMRKCSRAKRRMMQSPMQTWGPTCGCMPQSERTGHPDRGKERRGWCQATCCQNA